ncbi:MAG: hypothetical protein J7513_03590 [Solirubrobacteraceae bacterium]|nr:hypothetical protein [Solirubrobacteraceae bacterium]
MFRTALAAAAALVALAAPSMATASTANTMEPVMTLAGADPGCNPGSSLASGLSEVLTSSLIAPGTDWYNKGARPLASDMVGAWRSPYYGDTYDQCGHSANQLANAFYTRLLNFRNGLQAKYPTKNITKVDVVGVSYGTTISRLCIQKVPGCAALVDDWIGAVPPSHGSTGFAGTDCNTWGPYKFECYAGVPGGQVVNDMNGVGTTNDETPYGEKDTGGWIEYTTLRAQNDGVIFPAGSERLVGASNFQVIFPAGGSVSTHANWSGTGAGCAGSSAWTQSGTTEAIAAELLDVTDRSGRLASNASMFDAPLSCNWPY